jgi:hypothetical protein
MQPFLFIESHQRRIIKIVLNGRGQPGTPTLSFLVSFYANDMLPFLRRLSSCLLAGGHPKKLNFAKIRKSSMLKVSCFKSLRQKTQLCCMLVQTPPGWVYKKVCRVSVGNLVRYLGYQELWYPSLPPPHWSRQSVKTV